MNKITELFEKGAKLYFLGIGGISMSSLAVIAKDRGCIVAGYDRTPSALTAKVEKAGIKIDYTADPHHVDGFDAVVYTAAMPKDTPELQRAAELSIPCINRADFLGGLMLEYKGRIGVAGMHGKSTTTSMVSDIFLAAELDPTIVSGAELSEMGGAYRIGGDEFFIFEACEYTDSFLHFFPSIAIVLNIDRDHVDYFQSMEQTVDSFRRYIALADIAVLNLDDKYTVEAASDYKGRKCFFSARDTSADYYPKEVSYNKGCAAFTLMRRGEEVCRIELAVPGEHCLCDALAAAAAADISGVSPEAISRGLAGFGGAKRRFEYKGSYNGVLLYDDYAHHPVEIKATLSAAKKAASGRVICVYQPHTYSRTEGLFNEFAGAFGDADILVFADIYSAREQNIHGISSADLALAASEASGREALHIDSFEGIAQYLKGVAEPGDTVIIMGAGDVYRVGEMFAAM